MSKDPKKNYETPTIVIGADNPGDGTYDPNSPYLADMLPRTEPRRNTSSTEDTAEPLQNPAPQAPLR
jgi:hypothetical protein